MNTLDILSEVALSAEKNLTVFPIVKKEQKYFFPSKKGISTVDEEEMDVNSPEYIKIMKAKDARRRKTEWQVGF